MTIWLISLLDSVYVKVFNVSRNSYINDEISVEISGFFKDGSEVFDTLTIKGEGWVKVPKGPHVIGLTALYQGERFPSQPIIPTDTSTVITIDVYDVSADSSNLTIRSHSIGIFKERGIYRVVELLSIKNDGKKAFRGPLMSVELPKKSERFNITGDEEDYFIKDNRVVLTPLILPGEGSFGYDYFVLEDYFKIMRKGALEYRVFADTGIKVKVKGGVFEGQRDFEGQKFNVWKSVGKVELEVGYNPLLREIGYYILAAVVIIVSLVLGIVFYRLRK
ncbi:MAG: hypothetical protein ABIL88_04040 [candidate division WOR-3 bacterium]